MIKTQVLNGIYQHFEEWSARLNPVCRRQCSACCSQNVTITAEEGTQILRWVIKSDLAAWFGDRLGKTVGYPRPAITNNGFARACINGEDTPLEDQPTTPPCPFLTDDLCGIYPVRPFSCRLFLSTTPCSATRPASLPEYYQEAAMAVSQILEHLGQKEYWGNMLDILPALCDQIEFHDLAAQLDPVRMTEARFALLTAQPLPAFLLSPNEPNPAADYLNTLLAMSLGKSNLESLCNHGWNQAE